MLVTTDQIKNQLVPRLENEITKATENISTDTSIVGSLSAIADSMTDTFVLNNTFNNSISGLSTRIAGISVAYIGTSKPLEFTGIFFNTTGF